MQLEDGTTLVVVSDTTRCRCGEQVGAGERAGRPPDGTLLCVYCLADLRAGRPSPSIRYPQREAAALAAAQVSTGTGGCPYPTTPGASS